MKKHFKHLFSAMIVATMVLLAFGSDESKSSRGSSNSSSSNSAEWHTCSTCGKKYEGKGWGSSSDAVGGDLSLFQSDFETECKDCAQKEMDKAMEARRHRGYQGY